MGWSLWYVMEMQARAAYYRELVRDNPGVTVLETSARAASDPENARPFLDAIQPQQKTGITIPERQNATEDWRISEAQREQFEAMCAKVRGDPEDTGRQFFRQGHRLATASASRRRAGVSG